MCRVLEISESGYYAWRNRKPSPRSQANEKLFDSSGWPIELCKSVQSSRTIGLSAIRGIVLVESGWTYDVADTPVCRPLLRKNCFNSCKRVKIRPIKGNALCGSEQRMPSCRAVSGSFPSSL